MFSLVLFALFGATCVVSVNPEVQIGDTTLVGRDMPLLSQDFFGGKTGFLPWIYAQRRIQVFHTLSLPLVSFASNPRCWKLQSPRMQRHSTLQTLARHAFNQYVSFTLCHCYAYFSQAVPASLLSEDCLRINVFRPSGIDANAALPVLFW